MSGAQVLLRATVVNASALRCVTPARLEARAEAVEVTLNGDVSAHTLTDDGVVFEFYNTSEVRIDAIAPLGGPAEGGTLVTLHGAGYVDHGGVFCRFGPEVSSAVPATLRSSTSA